MKKIDITGNEIVIGISYDELVILNNALNEVINGIEIPEFEIRVGFSKGEASALLESVRFILDHP